MLKKALVALLLFVPLVFSTATISFAQEEAAAPWGPNYDRGQLQAYRDAVEGDACMTPSLECLVHQTSRFIAIEWVNSILYPDGPPVINNNAPGEYSYSQPRTILGATGKLIDLMYEKPVAKTGVYVADVMNSAHITPKAYAQGVGFSALDPVLELWKAFRNLAYMFFVVIFIVIGFMIMFRRKINGQAAITAQQAIPSVIISLILVTFSYAIAGLMIDFMYLSMFLIIGIFGQTLPEGSQNLIDLNIFQVMGSLFSATDVIGFGSNIDLVSNFLDSLVDSEFIAGALGIIGGITLTLVLAIAILIGTVKLFFELLKSYASVIVDVVTAPLVLMFGAIPGRNPFSDWIKDLFGNLIVFPTVLLVLVLFYQFTSITAGGGNEGGFIPPFLLGRGQAGAIASLMGLALILALPDIVKDVKKRFVKEGFGSMIFKAAGDATKAGFVGGALVPGVAATTVPGAKMALAPFFGTKKSREAAKEGKRTILGRGLAGESFEVGKRYIQQRNQKKFIHNPTTGTTPTQTSRTSTQSSGTRNRGRASGSKRV